MKNQTEIGLFLIEYNKPCPVLSNTATQDLLFFENVNESRDAVTRYEINDSPLSETSIRKSQKNNFCI